MPPSELRSYLAVNFRRRFLNETPDAGRGPPLSFLKLRKEGKGEKKMFEAYAMKREAAGAHLPTPWSFETATRLDDRADYFWAAVSGKLGTYAIKLYDRCMGL